jgi:mono/diheme cytochrome c family protein
MPQLRMTTGATLPARPSTGKRRLAAWSLLLLFALAVAVAAYLHFLRVAPGTPIADGAAIRGLPNTFALSQGWSQQVREQASFTSFGSRLLPYAWFLNLERAPDRGLLRSDANLRRLGFLPAPRSAGNPAGLPVGMVRAVDERGQAWLGLGCAACHTGELRYRGQAIRIAGGAGLLDLDGFERELLQSLRRTDADPHVFARFAARVLPPGGDASALRAQLRQRLRWLQRRLDGNRTAVPYGYARMDAFGQIFNAIDLDVLDRAADVRAPDAPVSIPVLWSTPRMTRVQWNGSSPNDGIAPLVQNVTTALGVYGQLELAAGGGPGYASSADVPALGRIQQWNGLLAAPRWPEAILGRIDRERAARGRAIYLGQCQACHRLPQGPAGAPVEVRLVPVAQVGTDARMATNFATRSGATGALQGRPSLVFGGRKLAARERMIDIVVHLAVGASAHHPLAAAGAVARGHQRVSSPAGDAGLVYKARPLDGVWSSAPYLHNGSVPTLYELLSPPDRRARAFAVGDGAFDPVHVGLAPGPLRPGTSWLEVDKPGNGNGGHPYGTHLDEASRLDLLEFLKSI